MTDTDPVLAALAAELARALASPSAPSHAVLRATETWTLGLSASRGAASPPAEHHERVVAVDVRHGPPELDSAHGVRYDDLDATSGALPLGDDPDALRRAIWEVLAPAIRLSETRLGEIRAEHAVKPGPSDPSPDRSVEAPVVAVHPRVAVAVDRDAWRARLERLSARFVDPALLEGIASLAVTVRTCWVVDTDGSRVRHGATAARVLLHATAAAPDERITLSATRHAHRPEDLPDDAVLAALVDELRRDTAALAAAPEGEPASGPVLLAGPAAAVWLHEVVGHRVEGHRQKDDFEGQTFRGCVGRRILPAGYSLWDDPGVQRLAGTDLAGHYLHDDEGRPAERVDIVRDGVFAGFLTSRSPIAGFPRSNGHGRAGAHLRPTSRMGNIVLEVAEPVPVGALRERLLDEVRRRGLASGLLVDHLSGGFTLTGRFFPNAFSLLVSRAWRVFADGRPDEAVRGLDVVGTPLVALGSLLAAGDDPTVFNGTCGAESGTIPVAAVSPSLLFAELEVQRNWRWLARPPVLPAPTPGDDPLAAEVDRALGLALPGLPSPHFVAFGVRETESAVLAVLPGGLERRDVRSLRELGVEVRVGTVEVDSANLGGDPGFALAWAPTGDEALAREAWLLADDAWKEAAEGLARKVASRLERPTDAVRPADFDPTPGTTTTEEPPAPLDPARLDACAEALASALAGHPDLVGANARIQVEAGTARRVDSLGTRAFRAVQSAAVTIGATVRAPDGRERREVRHHRVARAADLEPDVLRGEVDALAGALRGWAGATRATDEWTGPVLLIGDAALAVVRDLLLPGLCATPDAEDDGNDELRRPRFRLGRRALPVGWSVDDDPGTWPGAPGARRVDDEGVPAGALRLVEHGVVRALLASRTPGPGAPASTGRAVGALGDLARAAPTQVTVTAPAPRPLDELRAEAQLLADAADCDAALEIDHLGADGAPFVARWRHRDGRTEAVRGLRFVGLGRSALLDVVAAGPSRVGSLSWPPSDDGTGAVPASFTLSAPALLLRRAALEPDGHPPTAPRPLLPPGRA